MLYKLHYFCQAAGANALGILLGVYIAEYTDATPGEIGLLYMMMPFVGMTFRPIICSYADRHQAHREYIIICELLTALSFSPFVIIPYLGEQFYTNNPRFCWYFLVSFKVLGDIAFGGAVSIGDSLTINYAARVGSEFSVYRIWGTISWMIFGAVTGNLNEIWFLPRYVAGFMVLIIASLCDALVCYLWPKDYFTMLTPSMIKKEEELRELEVKRTGKKLAGKMTRSLMPRGVVWAFAKGQLWRLVTCTFLSNKSRHQTVVVPPAAGAATSATKQVVSVVAQHHQVGDPEEGAQIHGQTDGGSDQIQERQNDAGGGAIGREAQIKTLLLLLRRDPRIVLYLVVFVGAGLALIPLSFFFMSLSERCHTENTCSFSQLGGYLQVSMAFVESFLFLHIKEIVRRIGRLNAMSIAFGMAAIKFIFYGTIWPGVNPHWSLASESLTGLIYGTFLTMMVETGHLFASEVELLVPELIERGVISADDEASREKLKLSLSATMQALIASANDGLGRGVGALAYGLVIEAYSYHVLWLLVGAMMICCIVALQLANLMEHCCNLKLGVKAPQPPLPHELTNGHKTSESESGLSRVELENLSNKLANLASVEPDGSAAKAAKAVAGLDTRATQTER